MKALRAFNIFLYLLIAIISVQAELTDYATNDENLGIIIKKLNEIEEKVDAMDHKLIDLTNAEYRNVRQWIDLSEKEFEMQQSLQKIYKKKIEDFSETQVEMKTEVIGLSKSLKNLIVTDLHDSQQKLNSNLEGYISSGNQRIIENLKNKSDEVVKILEAVQKDQVKLIQQITISDEQCSKTFISKLEDHSSSLNKILQEKHKNLLKNQIDIMKDFKKNTEKIDELSGLVQKSIPNSEELASRDKYMKNILTAEQLRSELHGLNKTIIKLSEKELEMQQSLQEINKKIEYFSETQNEMKTEVTGLSKSHKNVIESQRETSLIVNDLHDSQKKFNSNLEGYISSGNQKIIENLKNKSDEVVKILEAVQKDQVKLIQQITISDEQFSKTIISKLEGHSGNLNKILQEKHKNLWENQIEIIINLKKNSERIFGLSYLIQKSIPNSVHLASLNKTIIDLSNSMDTLIKFSIYNTTFDCSTALKSTAKDGVYKLNIAQTGLEPFDAYCKLDKDGGDGWTVIQRRFDGSVVFYRNWNDYKNGFGNLSGEYWLGLEKIHAMTSKRPHALWIGLGDFSGGYKYAIYSHFEIGSEDEGYYLKKLGNYSGDAGDGMPIPYSKTKFSTFDVDNDSDENLQCAVRSSGGWWFNNCNWSVLNGNYNDTRDGHGINWNLWHGYQYSLRYSIMAIRATDTVEK